MAVSLKQIAEASNVSIATVSRVLRGRGEIAPATRQRVTEAARRLQYRPNLLVKGLQTGRTQSCGVLMELGDPFLAQIFVGLQDELLLDDYAPVVLRAAAVPTGTRADAAAGDQAEVPGELRQIHRLLDRRVDGIVLRPIRDAASDRYLKEVWDRGLPLVAVDRRLPHSHADFVGSDDAGGGRQAAEHLLQLGHRRLGQIAGPAFTSTGRERAAGFDDAVTACPDAYCENREDPGFTDGYRPAVELLRAPQRPSAIFAGNDLIARGVYRAAAELGLHIPRDLSVIGFGDLWYAGQMIPRLTTIRQSPRRIGKLAARLMLQRLDGELPEDQVQHLRVPTRLVVRGSTRQIAT